MMKHDTLNDGSTMFKILIKFVHTLIYIIFNYFPITSENN